MLVAWRVLPWSMLIYGLPLLVDEQYGVPRSVHNGGAEAAPRLDHTFPCTPPLGCLLQKGAMR